MPFAFPPESVFAFAGIRTSVDNSSVANLEHVAILKKNVAEWNRWRKENPNVPVDLSRADLHMADLRQAKLSGADLSWADLSWADLSQADLISATLVSATLVSATLSGADLTNTLVGRTVFVDNDLSNVKGLE